jgi:hypothetical protein
MAHHVAHQVDSKTEYRDFEEIEFFRVSVAVAIAGISFVLLVAPGAIREKHEYLFTVMNRLSAGMSLGMSLVAMPARSYYDLGKVSNFMNILQAAAFVTMLAFEHLSAAGAATVFASYSYRAVDFVENEDTSTEIDDEAVNLTKSLTEIEAVAVNNMKKTLRESISKRVRFFPSAILLTTILYGLTNGFVIASQEHQEYGSFIGLILNISLMAFALGTMLEFLYAPQSYFFLFVLCFSLSSPIGIIIACFFNLSYSDYQYIATLNAYVTSFCSGTYLYLVCMHILPAELLYLERDFGGSIIKLMAMSFGFGLTLLPVLYTSYS